MDGPSSFLGRMCSEIRIVSSRRRPMDALRFVEDERPQLLSIQVAAYVR
jgi:hypothetical protein